MAVTEEQKKKMIELYEKMLNESARELASHRTPCQESERIKTVSRILGVKEQEVEFPPEGVVNYKNINDGEVIIPSSDNDEIKENIK